MNISAHKSHLINTKVTTIFFKENYSTSSARLVVKAAKATAKNLENPG